MYDFEHLVVVKRSGQRVAFNGAKIAVAIKGAFDDISEINSEKNINKVYTMVLDYIASVYGDRKTINVEDIQDIIETTLKKAGFQETYQAFNEYRLKRAASREAFSVKAQHKFVKAVEKIAGVTNLDENKPLDLMINFGKTVSQEYAEAYLIENKYVRAHDEGRIFIKGLSSYALGITESSHLDFSSIYKDSLDELTTYIIYLLSHYKEEQYQEQTIGDIDKVYMPVLLQEFKKSFLSELRVMFTYEGIIDYIDFPLFEARILSLEQLVIPVFDGIYINERVNFIIEFVYQKVIKNMEEKLEKNFRKLFLSIEDFHFKLSSDMVCFSIFLGVDDWKDSFIKNVYFKTLKYLPTLKHVTTVCKIVSTSDFSLIYSIIHQNILLLYVDHISYDESIECFSDGKTIHQNINSDTNTSKGKILLSTVCINLARLGLKYTCENMEDFYNELEGTLELVKNALIQRFDFQASKIKENYDYLFKEEVLYDSYKLESNQKVRKVFRNGTLNVSYVGFITCLKSLLKKDVLEVSDFDFGLEILRFIKEKLHKYSCENKLNFVLSEESCRDVNHNLLTIDKALYGVNLKSSSYQNISDALKNFSLEEKMKIAHEIENNSCFPFDLVLPRNVSYKKFEQIVQGGFDNSIKVIKVRSVSNDN